MNKANECTCPSGDGSLVHPCPAHPAVEQAGGDERAADAKPCATRCPDCGEHDLMPGDLCACGYETDPATGYACSECDGSGEGCVGEVCRECDGSGWFVTPDQARAALAQPSPAQAEQAEAERPEVVAYADPVAFATFKERGHEGGVAGREWMWAEPGAALVAMSRTDECERIVGELRADRDSWAEQAEQRLADWDEMRKERDAALARVAELERQEPVDVPGPDEIHQMAFEEGQPAEDGDGYLFSAEEFDLFVQRLLDSCATPVAWAQHSVPEGWMLVECGIWTQEQVDEMQKTVTRFRNSEFVDDRALAMAVADAGQCKAPEISLAELLAAAPVCRLSRSALTDAQMRRLYDSSTETENERLGFAAFARLIRRAEAVHQITAAPGKEGV
ncbi:hypothetical protein R5H17_010635 [Pseudomonas aeruginosa]|uniref:hypothetical protein n=1 Tax=Pseudomonas aeruginosa TaxID=287 RepID=UPI0029669899|nr:hypothetical protein [Pseudomonas aeruginosa]MDW2962932.1 hypothetical protein [Pseudomonas aeruginosa]HEJ1384516.1 hypothetical protein [Pseudomonas aeruginosa]HEJ1514919.1 hypothetical protein [Pseudomonas aeruginosa]HEJ2394305.1 hypothetical protein [Pseudomonas aeruginosa]HEJ6495863.1 hypothetical protein [Pseudomonas aeruginosa]